MGLTIGFHTHFRAYFGTDPHRYSYEFVQFDYCFVIHVFVFNFNGIQILNNIRIVPYKNQSIFRTDFHICNTSFIVCFCMVSYNIFLTKILCFFRPYFCIGHENVHFVLFHRHIKLADACRGVQQSLSRP